MKYPYRKTARRDFLGGNSADTYIQLTTGEDGAACHMSANREYFHGDAQACVGSIICATKSFKSYKPGKLRQHQDRLHLSTPPETVDAIMNIWQFREHHKGAKALFTGLVEVITERIK